MISRLRTPVRRRRCRAAPALAAAALAIAAAASPAGAEERRPFDAELQDIFDVRISQDGLDFLAGLLADGLEQEALRQEAVKALEDQSFEILVPPPFGEYATIIVDYGENSDHPHKEGFRYDDVEVALNTYPDSGAIRPENGVLYPRLELNGWSQGSSPGKLPELHTRIIYEPLGFTAANPLSAVAFGRLETSGLLRPYIGEGTVSVLVEQFDTFVQEFEVQPVDAAGNPILDDDQANALGEAVEDAWRKELEDALSDVLQSGINDILFDRDVDGEPDTLLDVADLFTGLNDALDTDFGFTMTPDFQTNATIPTAVYLRTDGSMFLNTPGEDCVGPDIVEGFRFTNLERDGIAGHDPPQLVETAPNVGERAQFALSLSDDFLNQILFNAYRTGLACIFVNPHQADLPAEITDLLVTDSFQAFPGFAWIAEEFPESAIGLQVRMLEAPTATVPAGGEEHLRVRLPAVQIDLLVELEGRWLRLMGAVADVSVAGAFADFSLTGDAFVDLELGFDVTNRVNYSELVPDRAEDLADLLPTAFSLLEGVGGDGLGGVLDGNVTECIAGLDVSLSDVAPLGVDAEQELAHYLGVWLSLEGQLDLNLLFECLLGEPLVAPPAGQVAAAAATAGAGAAPAAPDDLPLLTVPAGRPLAVAELAGREVVRWRFEPGFWHRGGSVVPAMPLGQRIWAWQEADGSVHRLRLEGRQGLDAPAAAGMGCRAGAGAPGEAAGLGLLAAAFLLLRARRRRASVGPAAPRR